MKMLKGIVLAFCLTSALVCAERELAHRSRR